MADAATAGRDQAGCRSIGLTIAPVMPLPDWANEYGQLLDDVATALADQPDVDLTVELITHRFTEASKAVLLGWYPRTRLDLDQDHRARKRSKFGGVKYVYPAPLMRQMRAWFEPALRERLPAAQVLYWTRRRAPVPDRSSATARGRQPSTPSPESTLFDGNPELVT